MVRPIFLNTTISSKPLIFFVLVFKGISFLINYSSRISKHQCSPWPHLPKTNKIHTFHESKGPRQNKEKVIFLAASLFGERRLLTKDLGDCLGEVFQSLGCHWGQFLIPGQLQSCPWARRRSVVRTRGQSPAWSLSRGCGRTRPPAPLLCSSCVLRTVWFHPISSTENFPFVTGLPGHTPVVSRDSRASLPHADGIGFISHSDGASASISSHHRKVIRLTF